MKNVEFSGLVTMGIDTASKRLRPEYKRDAGQYKDSLFGKIPKDWQVVRLDSVCSMKSGDGITSESITKVGQFPVYGGNGLRGFTNKYTHEGKYILIGRQGALCGNVTNVSGKFYASEHAVVVTVADGMDVTWLLYSLEDMKLNKYSEASAQPGLSVSKILRLPLRKPLLDEQKLIAQILSTIDGQIEKTEAIIAKYQAVKQGMLQDLFTRGIDVITDKLRPSYEDAPELYKDSPLGMIPREWEVEKLEQVCDMKSGDGITSERIKSMDKYPVYGGNGLRGYTESYTHYGYYVLVGRQGALCGNVTRAKGKFFASEHAVVVTLKNGMDTDWIGEKLELMNLNRYSEASAQPGLSVSKIQRLLIGKPKLQEQVSISSKLNQATAKIQTEENCLGKMRSIKQGLMSDLLTGKVEVKK